MGEHTPTTEVIRERATKHAARFGFLQELSYEDQFDRWLEAHDARIASEAAERALREAATDMRSDKDPGHWNLRVNGDPEHAASPDAWLEYRADRIRAEREGAKEDDRG